MKANIFSFPIDNKHLMEDFTADFHDDQCVEFIDSAKIHHQAFWKHGLLCTIRYRWGQNWFHLEVHTGEHNERLKVIADFNEILKAYCENYQMTIEQKDYSLSCIIKKQED